MSFILDALKKLEEKRQTESVPDLSTVHIKENIPKKRSNMAYILIGLLLLNAVVLTLWLRPQQKDNILLIPQAAKENVKIPPPSLPKSNEMPITKNILPVQEIIEAAPAPDIIVPKEQEVPETETASLPINPSPEEIRLLKSKIAEERLLVSTAPSPEPALEEEPLPVEEEISSASEQTLLDMSQIPLSIRKELPDLTLIAHIYSNHPASRLINIKGSVIREGETVAAGLKVNEITKSGVIFEYGELLFKISAF